MTLFTVYQWSSVISHVFLSASVLIIVDILLIFSIINDTALAAGPAADLHAVMSRRAREHAW